MTKEAPVSGATDSDRLGAAIDNVVFEIRRTWLHARLLDLIGRLQNGGRR